MGRKDEIFSRLFWRRMDFGKLSLFFWMGVSCWTCRVSNRFGQWTATNPFTPQRSMADVWVWLGVQTGNQWTTREWTRPGNRSTISFWLGEFINGRVFAGLHALFHIIIILLFELSNELESWQKNFWLENGFSGLILDWQICVHILIFFSMNVFFSRKKTELNMNIGEHGSKQASTFVHEFVLVYFLKSLLN
jgi:hypothetical protein